MQSETVTSVVLERLVAEGVLTAAQFEAVAAALAAEESKNRPPPGKLLAEIAAYVGAGLLFGGSGLVLAGSWENMAQVARVVTFAVVTIGLAGGGIALAGGFSALFHRAVDGHTARLRLATVLFALAAAAMTVTLGIAVDNGGSHAAWAYATVAGTVAAVLGYLALPSLTGLLTCAVFSAVMVPTVLDVTFDVDEPWIGVGLFVLGGVWFALTRIGAFAELWVGYSVAILISVVGAQLTGDHNLTPAYLLTAVVAVACFALYATQRSAVLVIGGGAAIALAAAEAVWTWTDGTVGAAGAVLAVGAIVLIVGAVLLSRASKTSP
ncbi:hypothetical protein ACFQZZ_29825 [Nocardia sp. GCM10030253]|uniref:hypothetical protein n=1 Tax=Nocardia sp. GCM10030253 TaxID=3273404 RepID=UPI0036314C67